MTLGEWRKMPWPTSRWRHQARRRILHVVYSQLADADPAKLLAAVDAAYPFGGWRSGYPYKAWLVERKLFREALAGPPTLPSADEIGVCEVARDLVELGRIDEARKLVEEQAPNRHARKCGACGAAPGESCREPVQATAIYPHLGPPNNEYAAMLSQHHRYQPLLVPHHARLVGHADPGPLFAPVVTCGAENDGMLCDLPRGHDGRCVE